MAIQINLICTEPDERKPEVTRFRSLGKLCPTDWMHMCDLKTNQRLSAFFSGNCIATATMHRTATSGWSRNIVLAPEPSQLQPAPRGHDLFLWCTNRENGFQSLDTEAVCWVCFVPTEARSSWRGLLTTCTSLEQHSDCWDWQREGRGATPRNLTEPLWQRADRWKQLERDGQMRKERRKDGWAGEWGWTQEQVVNS